MPTIEPEKHFFHLRHLLEIEEAEEIEAFKQDFLQLTPEERELVGKALLRLRLKGIHFNLAGHRLLTLAYSDGRKLPLFTFEPGDLVTIAREGEPVEHLPMATVYERESDSITLAYNHEPPEWLDESGIYHLNLAGNRSTYQRMYQALKQISNARDNRLEFLRDLSLGLRKPERVESVSVEEIQFHNSNLNLWQKRAVAMAMGVKDIGLIHGPPGTGKTTALVEIIHQAVKAQQFVLATAPSNTACDYLLHCLVQAGIDVLRLGHPARITEELRGHTLDFKMARHPLAKTIRELEAEILRLEKQKDRIREGGLAGREKRREISADIHQLEKEIEELDDQIFDQITTQATVVIATHTGCGDKLLHRKTLDLVIMDEASQAIEPNAWIALLRAERAILAGDHFQLPPTVKSKKAEELGLGRTLFERLMNLLPESNRILLKTQYRMNEKIMNFSSKEFYQNQLIADESVRKHTLADLAGVESNSETAESFLFLDTAGRGFEELLEPGSESRYNPEEAKLVIEKTKQLLSWGVKAADMAIICPYSAQVRWINSQLPHPDIEVDSVDGFQGSEKEAVIVSLVRSNMEGELGFLADIRRMNVAMTRARRKLIVIGDSSTLSTIPFYKDFIDYAESIQAYRSSWEELQGE